jgi:hypothetical protein
VSPYLLALLLPRAVSPSNPWGVPRGFTTADLNRQIRADERYPTHNLPERRALEARLYWESVRADDAAEYASECAAAAAYTF